MATEESPISVTEERQEALEELAESDLPCAEIADSLLDLADDSEDRGREEAVTA